MDIRLLRIDDRLIHGQVATTWSKFTGISRIIVVSDDAASHPLQKILLTQAAPPEVKSHVVSIRKLNSIAGHALMNDVKVMLLFTNPKDVMRVHQSGLVFNSVNIGGMKYTEGKQMVTHSVSVDQTDINAFKYLNDKGIELEIRKVPGDRSQKIMDVLKKGNFL
ncbi:MAG: PTS sugar transporter subunit IIB [Alkalibacterium sp.]|nr:MULTISPECIES: PTS sugar transporter subunit IIB [Alkalibacterium]MDN6193481.1 PTS sugar transporter subunit IIB [Alkalibacterium sp.]MDN6294185.1 PTS sugar transporter subunit IIB [Alkalibacterium sp.]MDN6295088.1 PTS sugar transporter subunit IIB [Alkalibacterium sp.]MDN6326418.1 PTS sugar transporter subunit IIB [Alkalibacterium sp.]MDN6385143.1 PTS sugar transporter subunit IIB [Alkalibacterium sp.]